MFDQNEEREISVHVPIPTLGSGRIARHCQIMVKIKWVHHLVICSIFIVYCDPLREKNKCQRVCVLITFLECSQTSLQTFYFTIRTSSTKSGFAFCPRFAVHTQKTSFFTWGFTRFLPPAYAPISWFQTGTSLISYDHHLGKASSQQPHPEMEEAPLLLERVLITSGTAVWSNKASQTNLFVLPLLVLGGPRKTAEYQSLVGVGLQVCDRLSEGIADFCTQILGMHWQLPLLKGHRPSYSCSSGPHTAT